MSDVPTSSLNAGEGRNGGEQRIAEALAPFGWTCAEDFWQRYYSDAWVFNLANAVERLSAENEQAHLAYIEASNPGIDMADVRRIRAEQKAARIGGGKS